MDRKIAAIIAAPTTAPNERKNTIAVFIEKEIDAQLKLMKRSPLYLFWIKSKIKCRLIYAILSAELRKLFTGREYVVFTSDYDTHFYVFSEREMSGILRYAKRRLFMRRPEMRKRIVYRTSAS